jgi:hypothetical protein
MGALIYDAVPPIRAVQIRPEMNALKQRTRSSLRAQPNVVLTLPLCRVCRQVELIQFDIIVAPPPVEIQAEFALDTVSCKCHE